MQKILENGIINDRKIKEIDSFIKYYYQENYILTDVRNKFI